MLARAWILLTSKAQSQIRDEPRPSLSTLDFLLTSKAQSQIRDEPRLSNQLVRGVRARSLGLRARKSPPTIPLDFPHPPGAAPSLSKAPDGVVCFKHCQFIPTPDVSAYIFNCDAESQFDQSNVSNTRRKNKRPSSSSVPKPDSSSGTSSMSVSGSTDPPFAGADAARRAASPAALVTRAPARMTPRGAVGASRRSRIRASPGARGGTTVSFPSMSFRAKPTSMARPDATY